MVLSGYEVIYAIECNTNMVTKVLKKLMKDADIVDKASYQALQLGIAGDQISFSSVDSTEEKTLIDLIETLNHADSDENDEEEMDDEDQDPIERCRRREKALPHAFKLCINALLKKKGYNRVELITKHCCFNDNQVFFGSIIGNNSVICGDDVHDYNSIEDWFEEEITQINQIANVFHKRQDAIDSELQSLVAFFPDLKKAAKVYKFANDCDSCN
jgi:hypothetical protein